MSPNDKPETRCAKCGSLMFDKHRNCLMCGEKNAPTPLCACGHDWPDWSHTPTGCKPMRYNPATGEHDLAPATEGAAVTYDGRDRLTKAEADIDALRAEVERLKAGWDALRDVHEADKLTLLDNKARADAAEAEVARRFQPEYVHAVEARVAELTRERDEAHDALESMVSEAVREEERHWSKRVAFLSSLIEEAPHALKCSYSFCGQEPCDCWKAKAEVGK